MKDPVEDAIEVLRQLPEDMQEIAARAIIALAAEHDDICPTSR